MAYRRAAPMAEQRVSRWYFGGLASCGAACCTHPLDLLKVKGKGGNTEGEPLLGGRRAVLRGRGMAARLGRGGGRLGEEAGGRGARGHGSGGGGAFVGYGGKGRGTGGQG